MEHVADERERRGCQRGAGHAQDRARHDQHRGIGGEGGEDRSEAKGQGADHQQFAPADAVAEIAHDDERAGDEEAIDVDDPQKLRGAGLQLFAQLRHRQIEDHEVHRIDEAGQRNDGEADPFAAAGLGWRFGSGHGPTLSYSNVEICQGLVEKRAASEVGDRAGHGAGAVGSHEGGRFGHLVQRRVALEQGLRPALRTSPRPSFRPGRRKAGRRRAHAIRAPAFPAPHAASGKSRECRRAPVRKRAGARNPSIAAQATPNPI